MMNLCIPFNSIERIGNKLSTNSWISYGRRTSTPESRQQIVAELERGDGAIGGPTGRHENHAPAI